MLCVVVIGQVWRVGRETEAGEQARELMEPAALHALWVMEPPTTPSSVRA